MLKTDTHLSQMMTDNNSRNCRSTSIYLNSCDNPLRHAVDETWKFAMALSHSVPNPDDFSVHVFDVRRLHLVGLIPGETPYSPDRA